MAKVITAPCGCRFSKAGWHICRKHWATPTMQIVYQRMKAEGKVLPPPKKRRSKKKWISK